jgi:two-component sensor histidine kinase
MGERHAWSLRRHLVVFGLAITLPVLAFSALLLAHYEAIERAQIDHRALEIARALTADVDRELAGIVMTLQALATSPALDAGDFAGFYRQAQALRRAGAHSIVLRGLDNQQLVNTGVAWGTALGQGTPLDVYDDVRKTLQPRVSGLFTSAVSGRRIAVVVVPAVQGDGLRFFLTMALDPQQLSGILSQGEVPAGWIATLIDHKGTILARSRDNDAFAGAPMPLAQRAPGIADAAAAPLGGGRPLRAHAWSKLSGWLISVEVPTDVLEDPVRHTWLILAASGTGMLTLSMALALWLGHRLAWPIQAAAQRATLLGDGGIVPPLTTALREANDVNRALSTASLALRERTDALRETEVRLTANIERRKKTEEHIRFIMREVTHRAKNLLAVIQSIAKQTASRSASLHDFEDLFQGRLRGLAASIDLLVQESWQGAAIRDIVRSQLAHYRDEIGGQITMTGPDVFLSPEATQNIGFALHELATNASKYGALSSPQGRVEVRWSIDPPGSELRRFRLTWIERNGPRVEPPRRKGFGHVVLGRIAAHGLNGKATFEFAPEGISWLLEVPASHVRERAG